MSVLSIPDGEAGEARRSWARQVEADAEVDGAARSRRRIRQARPSCMEGNRREVVRQVHLEPLAGWQEEQRGSEVARGPVQPERLDGLDRSLCRRYVTAICVAVRI
jgi:hypothetical protein